MIRWMVVLPWMAVGVGTAGAWAAWKGHDAGKMIEGWILGAVAADCAVADKIAAETDSSAVGKVVVDGPDYSLAAS